MDNKTSDSDLLVDLESGGNTSEEDGLKDMASSDTQSNKVLGKVWSGFVSFDGSPGKGLDAMNSYNVLRNPMEVHVERVELLAQEKEVGLMENNTGKVKPKKKSNKKASKPPRPPKPLTLDAADQKLVKEISELAMLKKARMERMKALKKMKTSKSASSSGNMCAMVVTIIFCLVIIFQGVFSRGSSTMSSHGSPESAMGRGRLISIQYFKNTTTSKSSDPGSESPYVVEQVSGLPEERQSFTN